MFTFVVGIVIAVAGIWMSVISLHDRRLRKRLLKQAVKVRGKVIRFDSGTKQDAVTVETVTPVVEYKARDGRPYEFYLPTQLTPQPLSVGSSVTIYYEQDNPGNATESLRMWDVNIRCGICFFVLLFGLGLLLTCYQKSISGKPDTIESRE